MKKFLVTFFISMLITSTVYAANVEVQLNGRTVDFTDSEGNKVNAQIISNRTMVPMRKLFELLGATVDWNGVTKNITATKDDTTIVLQIDNDIAQIIKNNVTKNVTLDSKPIIVENRTLVPLRFISESLGKQVGWDTENRTAIIIDYDYFANNIKEKSNVLYNIMTSMPQNGGNIKITREYFDNLNTSNNTTSTINVNYIQNQNTQNVFMTTEGDSLLFKEIESEGWNTSQMTFIYDEEGVTCKTIPNTMISNIIKDGRYTYDELELVGRYNASLGNCMEEILNLNSEKLNINSFKNIRDEYERFIKLFSFSTTTNGVNIKCKNLNFTNSNNTYIDFTKFDNIIMENEFVQLYNVINKLIFNYDVKLDELLYDTSNIEIDIKSEMIDGVSSVLIRIEATNNYDEKYIYSININKN